MPDQDPMKQIVNVDLDLNKSAKKINAWQRLQDSAQGIDLPRVKQPTIQDDLNKKIAIDRSLPDLNIKTELPPPPTPKAFQPTNLKDLVEEKVKSSPAAKVLGDMIENPEGILPEWKPSDFSNDPNNTPLMAGIKTFAEEVPRRLYEKMLRPMVTPENIAIGVGMTLVPPAAIPYLTMAMAGPMVIGGYKAAVEAQKEKDPIKKAEMYSDATIQMGMGVLIGTKHGAELLKKVGEVPVVEAVKRNIAKSRFITDESGAIDPDLLFNANKISKEINDIYGKSKETNKTSEAIDPTKHISWIKLPNGKVNVMKSDSTGKIIFNEDVPALKLEGAVGKAGVNEIVNSTKKYGDIIPAKKEMLPPSIEWDKYKAEAMAAAAKGEESSVPKLKPTDIKPEDFDPNKHVLIYKLGGETVFGKWYGAGFTDKVQGIIKTLKGAKAEYKIVPEGDVDSSGIYTGGGGPKKFYDWLKDHPELDKASNVEEKYDAYLKGSTPPVEPWPPHPDSTKPYIIEKDSGKKTYYANEKELNQAIKGYDKDHVAFEMGYDDPTSGLYKDNSGAVSIAAAKATGLPKPPSIGTTAYESIHKPITNSEFNTTDHALVYLEDGEWKAMTQYPHPIQNIKGDLKSSGIDFHVVPKEEITNGVWTGDLAGSANDTNWAYVKVGPDKWTINKLSDTGEIKTVGEFTKKQIISDLPPDVSKVIITNPNGHGVVTKEMIDAMYSKAPAGPVDTITEIDPANYNPKTDTVVFKAKSTGSWHDYSPGNMHIDDVEKIIKAEGYEYKIVPKSSLNKFGEWEPPTKPLPVEPITVFDASTDITKHNIGGLPFKSVHPDDLWKGTKGSVPNAPPMPILPYGKTQSTGTIIMEPDGRIWLVEPDGHYGGYEHTFPKGGQEAGFTAVENAIKETFEETGLKVQPKEYFGDFAGDTTSTRYYIADRIDGSPADFGSETQSVKLVTLEEAKKLLNKPRDQQIIDQLIKKYGKTPAGISHPPSINLGFLDIDATKMSKVGGQKGSNPGGWYQAPSGEKYYIKQPKSADHAKNEVLGAKLYQLAGVEVPDVSLAKTEGGHLGVASKEITGLKQGKSYDLTAAQGAKEGLAVDAWLGNWDVIGLANDNMMIGANGKAIRLDTGGSLRYRAQGAEKGAAFGNNAVSDLRGLRDQNTNSEAAAVFGSLTDTELASSIKRLKSISNSEIKNLVDEYGPDGVANKEALTEKLIKRKESLVNHGIMIESNAQYDGVFKTHSPLVSIKDLTPRDGITQESNLQLMSNTPTLSMHDTRRHALESFKATGHHGINSIARGKVPETQASSSSQQNHKLMRELFDRLNPTPWSGTLHRGVPWIALEKVKQVGDLYEDPGFASWSSSPTVAHNWNQSVAVLKLEMTGKNKILTVGKALDELDSEYESILFNNRIRIIRIQEVPKLDYDGKPSPYNKIKEYWGVVETE